MSKKRLILGTAGVALALSACGTKSGNDDSSNNAPRQMAPRMVIAKIPRASLASGSLESAKFVDLNSAHIPTHWQGGTMDRVLAPAEQPEFTPREFTVYSDAFLKARALSPRDYKRAYSDHYLISTTIRILPDDD